ncbi:hypothetical protein AKJ16_DCAP04436 [Drosera capensis]
MRPNDSSNIQFVSPSPPSLPLSSPFLIALSRSASIFSISGTNRTDYRFPTEQHTIHDFLWRSVSYFKDVVRFLTMFQIPTTVIGF